MLWFPKFIIAAGYASAATLVSLEARQIQWPTLPNNLTEDVLQIASAISPPCAGINTNCQQLTNDVVPRCLRLRGVCMANPTDNQTTPTQTEAATAGHNAFHIACNAYESYINSTDTMSPTSPVSPTASAAHDSPNESKVLVGPIVGGVVGGIVGLALVAGIIYLLSVRLKRNDHRHDVRPSSVSIFSSENKNSNVYASPYPQLPASYPAPVPGHISPRNRETMYVPELMEPITGPPQPRTPEISH
ncbi:hypothetical protein RHS03_01281, partial [Rhizoctonia solani]